MPYLTLKLPGEGGLEAGFLVKQELTIGREAGNEIVLPHREVSRKHCVVRVVGEMLSLEDLGSSNGTQINGKLAPAQGVQRLGEGDQIQIGPFLFLVSTRPGKRSQSAGTMLATSGLRQAIRVRVVHGVQARPMESRDLQMSEGLVIGSDPSCDLVVSHPDISGRHLRIVNAPDGPRAEDLGSARGTFFVRLQDGNVDRLQRLVRANVEPGSLLQLGEAPFMIEVVGLGQR
ncbi:MAG: FHA domain-containing protein [Candidatus Schekmanbacteria bacterium]|nr:FHA domain-containing protein [Candidatus Schekmanbacteria bacterium]